MLVRRADTCQAPGHDLAAFGDELAEHPVVLVIDVLDFFHAEFADFLAPEKFASAFTGWTAGSGTSAET